MEAWIIGSAGFGLAVLTFLWKVYADSRREREEDCNRCFSERDLLRVENKKLREQVFELMLATMQDKA